MKITALVENQSACGLKPRHGLSLYIETAKHKILFDVGPDDTLFQNARQLGVDLQAVDTVILSHGHKDHGGGLEKFLTINPDAKVYAQRKAFEKHYSKAFFLKVNIGISQTLLTHPRMILLDGDHRIDEELLLFTVPKGSKCLSDANSSLYTAIGKDNFAHEQNLMIFGHENVLIMGCGHRGVVNILKRAEEFTPRVCIGGYHLWNPTTNQTVSRGLLETIVRELAGHDIRFYTCHCTGQEAYAHLANKLPNMHYLSCGEQIEV